MKFRCDPLGIFCFILFYLLIAYVDYVCLVHLFDVYTINETSHYALVALYQILLFMVSWSHMMCLLSNPGVVDIYEATTAAEGITQNDGARIVMEPTSSCNYSINNQSQFPSKRDGMTSNNSYPFSDPTLRQASSMMMANGEWTYCKRCYIYRPPRAHHCHVCRRCILNMDHHCPWINNCVGEYNQKYFMQFTAYCFVTCIYTVIIAFVSLVQHEHSPVKLIHIVLIGLVSIIFGLFAIAVLCDQMESTFKNTTTIERLKGRRGSKVSKAKTMRRICGHHSALLWWLPLPIPRKVNIMERMGYKSTDVAIDVVTGENVLPSSNNRHELYEL